MNQVDCMNCEITFLTEVGQDYCPACRVSPNRTDMQKPLPEGKTMRKTFTIAYRTGTEQKTIWKKSRDFEVFDDAQREKRQIEMTGSKALIFDTRLLNSIGLPVGWDAYITDCDHE